MTDHTPTPRTDALRKQFENWTNATDRFHDEEQEKFWKMVEEMERAIAKGTTWVPVGERLPEKSGWVLTWEPARQATHDPSWTVQPRTCINYFVAEDAPPKYFGIPGFHDQRVTHWMPLPEPPK